MKRIALTIERMRAYGRNVCEGVAAYAQERRLDWDLEFVDSRAVGGRGGYAGFDGAIVRVMDDRTAARLAALRRPVVDIFCRKAQLPGAMNERVNLSNWEGENGRGEVFYGGCWCEASFLLMD